MFKARPLRSPGSPAAPALGPIPASSALCAAQHERRMFSYVLQVMQVGALAGIATFFIPNSPMFLPDAYAHGTAFLCRNPDPSWHEVGLARLRRMLAWFPGDRYLQILAEGGIANSLVDIATGEDAGEGDAESAERAHDGSHACD